jgi:hypothetical protein
MDINEFFSKNWYRDTLVAELGLPKENHPLGSGVITFNELREKVARKHLGNEVVDSLEFKKRWLEHEIKVYEKCIQRDEANYNTQPKRMQKTSVLPRAIAEDRVRVEELRAQLIALNK